MSVNKRGGVSLIENISICNFDEIVSEVILMRGMDYYESGNIISLDVFDNEISAVVAGYDDYEVKIIINEKGQITYHYCNCLYEGEYCKHEVAVMYALREYFKTNSQNIGKKEGLKELLKKQQSDVIVEILCNLASNDKKLREKLYMKFK